MTWAAFQSTLLLALAGLVPVAIYWLKLWINGKIAELQAKSDANKTRLDQHAEAITDIQQLHGGMAAPAVTQSIPQTSVSSTTPSEPVTQYPPMSKGQQYMSERDDGREAHSGLFPSDCPLCKSLTAQAEPVTPSSDVLHETPDRLRVGVNDPHNVAPAIIEALTGLSKA